MASEGDKLAQPGHGCEVILFPLAGRVGRIRQVAAGLAKRNPRQAEFYRRQVTDGLLRKLHGTGLQPHMALVQIDEFWRAVDRALHHSNPRGEIHD